MKLDQDEPAGGTQRIGRASWHWNRMLGAPSGMAIGSGAICIR